MAYTAMCGHNKDRPSQWLRKSNIPISIGCSAKCGIFADAQFPSRVLKINLLNILSCDRLLAAKAPKKPTMVGLGGSVLPPANRVNAIAMICI